MDEGPPPWPDVGVQAVDGRSGLPSGAPGALPAAGSAPSRSRRRRAAGTPRAAAATTSSGSSGEEKRRTEPPPRWARDLARAVAAIPAALEEKHQQLLQAMGAVPAALEVIIAKALALHREALPSQRR